MHQNHRVHSSFLPCYTCNAFSNHEKLIPVIFRVLIYLISFSMCIIAFVLRCVQLFVTLRTVALCLTLYTVIIPLLDISYPKTQKQAWMSTPACLGSVSLRQLSTLSVNTSSTCLYSDMLNKTTHPHEFLSLPAQLFIYFLMCLFILAELGLLCGTRSLCCGTWAFSSCSKWASLVVEHRL